jgi:molybdate transport system substrate-binding protein
MRAVGGMTRRSMLAGAGGLLAAGAESAPQAKALTVFAAASLTEALTQISAAWQAQEQVGRQAVGRQGPPRFSFASSGALARQIDQGAPADLFLSADENWMDWLAQRSRLLENTRRDIVANRLVLVERKAGLKPVTLGPGVDPNAILGASGRLAVGDPASVPAGIYAKQALIALRLWDAVKDRLAPAENVRAALLLVERGETPAGIVYASDVRVTPDLAIAGTFPESSHKPIVYPGAVLKNAALPRQAEQLLSYLAGGTAQAIFHNLGFSSPPRP